MYELDYVQIIYEKYRLNEYILILEENSVNGIIMQFDTIVLEGHNKAMKKHIIDKKKINH